MITSVISRSVSVEGSLPRKRDRSSGSPTEGLAGVGRAAPPRQSTCAAARPTGRRHDGDVRAQQHEPRDTGLALHRPLVGVLGDRALGVDDDRLALLERRHRLAQRLGRVGRAAIDGDLLGAAHDLAEPEYVEHAGLDQESRDASGLPHEARHQHGVDDRDVVDRDDDAARRGRRDAVEVAPADAEQQCVERVQDRRRTSRIQNPAFGLCSLLMSSSRRLRSVGSVPVIRRRTTWGSRTLAARNSRRCRLSSVGQSNRLVSDRSSVRTRQAAPENGGCSTAPASRRRRRRNRRERLRPEVATRCLGARGRAAPRSSAVSRARVAGRRRDPGDRRG